MTVRIYKSTDDDAPVQTGLDPTLANVWTACLVDGFGDKEPAGWSKPFVSGNKSVYKQGPLGTRNQSFIRLLEGFHLFSSDHAVVGAYESMSDVDTGTNGWPAGFPEDTVVGKHGGPINWPDPIPWLMIADERTFHYFNRPWSNPPDSSPPFTSWQGASFGDFYPFDDTENYCQCMVAGGLGSIFSLGFRGDTIAGMGSFASYGICRSAAGGSSLSTYQVAGLTEVSWSGDRAKYVAANVGRLPHPNPADGRTYLAPILWAETATKIPRGHHRGLWHWCHTFAGATDQLEFDGSDTTIGRRFMNLKPFGGVNGNVQNAVVTVEISDTWDT